jgi:hypothetical protein
MPKPPTQSRLHIPHRTNYHVWSIRTITLVAIMVVSVTAISVFLLGKGSLFRETELTLAIIAAGLFVFLSIGLYRGVRVKQWDLANPADHTFSIGKISDHMPGDTGGLDFLDGLDGDEGCLAAIVGLLLAIFASVVLLFVLWIVLNLGIILWVFLLAALSWVFYLALRQVFAKSDICRGNWVRSMAYALLYTALYTGWLFAIVWIADGLLGAKSRAG